MLENQPLSSGDQAKLLIFVLLLAPSIVFLVGVVPMIFLAFGFYMMRKNQDFSSIETAVRIFKGYAWLAFIGCLISSLYYFFDEEGWHYYGDEFSVSLTLATIAIAYIIAVHFLFFSPLRSHKEWIVANGVFSSKAKTSLESSAGSELDIIKGEKLKQYSVADELIKWARLKDDGHITQDEFNEARKKLLKRA